MGRELWGCGYGGHMGLFGVGPILGLAIIGGVLYFLFREDGLLRGPSPGPRPESARDILDRRYASGELTKDQYEQMKRDLQ